MKRKCYFRIISTLLCIVLLFSSLSIPAFSITTQETNDNQPATISDPIVIDSTPNFNFNQPTESSDPGLVQHAVYEPFALKEGEKSYTELKAMTVNVATLPNFINENVALEKGHVNRVFAQEKDLNTVIYQNNDGSTSTYIFPRPVKYVDDNGVIKDKNTAVSEIFNTTYTYAMLDNSVKVYFPKNASLGTQIAFENYSISMAPITTATSAPMYSDGTVLYNGAFGANTIITYNTELNGLKEDIILVKNIGKNEFEFDLTLTNLTPVQTNGKWYLKNDNNTTIASFGDILIKDSANNTAVGSLNIVASATPNKYTVTIIAPQEFLNAETTVYPVYVDPTTYIWEIGTYIYYDEDGTEHDDTYNAIQDTGIYNTEFLYQQAADDYEYHLLGNGSSGTGRVVYKLYDFFGDNGSYKTLQDNQIGSAQLYLNVASGNQSTTFTVNPMMGTWDDEEFGENPIALFHDYLWEEFSTAYQSSQTIPAAGGVYSIDITDILRGWARYNAGLSTNAYDNPANGFMLSNSDTNYYRYINSVEEFYSSSVYVILDTSPIGGVCYINNVNSGRYLEFDNDNIVWNPSLYKDSDTIRWYFEYIGNGQYYIKWMEYPSLAICDTGYGFEPTTFYEHISSFAWNVYLSPRGGVFIQNAERNVVITLKSDGNFVLEAPPSDSASDAVYQQYTWSIISEEDHILLTDFELSDDWLLPGTSKYFNIKSEPYLASFRGNQNFTWSSSNSSFTVSDNGLVTASASGGITTLTVTHKMTGLTKNFTIKSGVVREGTYMLMNKGTGRYMDVEGPSKNAGAYIQQWDYHTGNQAKWDLTILPSGTCVIQSVYSGYWLKAGNDTDDTAIIQYSHYGTPSAKWVITQTSSGAYKLSPFNATGYALSVPLDSNSNGTNLVKQAYTNDSNYRDEWVFDSNGQAAGIENGQIYHIKAVHSNKALTVENGNTADNTAVQQNDIVPGYQWQRWKFLYIGNGDYQIQDMQSGKLLSVSEGSTSTSEIITIRDADNSEEQLFRVLRNDDGTYSFLPKSRRYLRAISVYNSSTAEGASIETAYFSETNNQKFNLIENNKAIIIVPGFGSSVLQMGSSFPSYSQFDNKDVFSYTNLKKLDDTWSDIKNNYNDLLEAAGEADCIFDIDEYIDEFSAGLVTQENVEAIQAAVLLLTLLCNSNGESYYDIVPKEFNAAEQSTEKYGFDNTYEGLYNNLKNVIIQQAQYYCYDLNLFSYDWRKSCADSAAQLDAFITAKGYDEVVLVCHSMGGLVGSAYLARGINQRNSVQKYVSFGTPHWGTVATPTICLTGDLKVFFGNLIEGEATFWENVTYTLCTDVIVKYVLSNIPSIYEMMPTANYINATGGYLTYGENTLCTSYAETKNVIANYMKGYNSSLMNSAEAFHNSLYIDNHHILTYVNSLLVYSNNHATVQWLTYDPELFGLFFRYSYSWNTGGDSLVPTVSATMNDLITTHHANEKTHMGMIDESLDKIL